MPSLIIGSSSFFKGKVKLWTRAPVFQVLRAKYNWMFSFIHEVENKIACQNHECKSSSIVAHLHFEFDHVMRNITCALRQNSYQVHPSGILLKETG